VLFLLGGVVSKKRGGSVRWWLCKKVHLSLTGNGRDQSGVGGHLLSEKPVAASAGSSLWLGKLVSKLCVMINKCAGRYEIGNLMMM
jgi:hypothetical protein